MAFQFVNSTPLVSKYLILLQGTEEVQGKIKATPQGDEREAAGACKEGENAGRRELRHAGEKCNLGETPRPSQHPSSSRALLLGKQTATLRTFHADAMSTLVQNAAFQAALCQLFIAFFDS